MSIGYDVTFPLPAAEWAAMYAAIGGLSAVLAHRGVSVFHDGLRPTIPSVRNGEMSRKEVSRISFALAWGFFWAFGLPFSVGFVVPLVYVIFMFSDWIGVSTPADHTRPWYGSRAARQGVAIAFVAGAAYGAAMAVALHLVTRAMHDVPVEMADVTPLFSKPALGVFLLFAILTAAYHFGVRRAAPTVVAGLAGWIFGEAIDYGQPASWGFVAAFVVLIAQLVQQIRAPAPPPEGAVAAWAVDDEDDDADEVFGQVRRIKSAAIPIVALAALMGAAYNWGFMAKDPVSGELYSLGLAVPAALVMLAWAFAFIPMKFTTAAVTGCMATGTFLDAGLAFLMPSPWVAAIAVGALRLVEIWSILPLVRLFERAPSIREVADVMRTAIFHVVEIGFLIGGALAAFQWAGELGFAAVIGAWWLNSRANSPVMPMSIGPTAALAVGVVANVLHVVGVPLT